VEAFVTSICPIFRAALRSARWARHHKRLCLEQAVAVRGEVGRQRAENLMLQYRVGFQAEQIACLRRRLKAARTRRPHALAERLQILWCVEYFAIPRRPIPKYSGIARSTVWRWLRRPTHPLPNST